MSAVTAPSLRVEFASPLEADGELLGAARLATRTLEKLVEENELTPADRELIWGVSSERPAQYVSPVLTERDEYGTRTASRLLPRSRLFDPILREGCMIELLLDVRGQRRERIGERLRHDIDELERQEAADAESDRG